MVNIKSKINYQLQKLYWNLHSKTWDNYLVDTEYKEEIEHIVRIIDSVKEEINSSLLDIGCATGNYTIEFAKKGYDVTGLDYSPAMIETAKNKSVESNLKNIQYTVHDLNNPLPFENNKFNFVVAAHILHGINNNKSCVSEIFRVLKPNGFLCLILKEKGIKKTIKSPSKNILITKLLKFVKPFVFKGFKGWNNNAENLIEIVNNNNFSLTKSGNSINNKVLIYTKK